MPYIYLHDRPRATFEPATPGELNFALTTMILSYLEKQGHCYDTMNEVIGALECSKMEIYRRLITPYENKKADENGDLYWGE